MSQSMTNSRPPADEPFIQVLETGEQDGVKVINVLVWACAEEPVDKCQFKNKMTQEEMIDEIGRVCEQDQRLNLQEMFIMIQYLIQEWNKGNIKEGDVLGK